ncbi:beta-ketoacyl synthase [Mycolicibacillus koreensis]|nr:beta-ketoacyl synthase [Mycolicibacillus koreensis]
MADEFAPVTVTPIARTLPDLLLRQAARYPDRVAFSFSRDGEEQHSTEITYRELDTQARRIAANLQQQGTVGERVLVLCPPGLDFIAGLFGCLYAGAIAVPVHPPMREHLVPRVASIVADVEPRFALTVGELHPRIAPTVDALLTGERALHWCVTDASDGDEDRWDTPTLDPDAIAMVQYTSGSTSTPKGVMLSHANLMHNLETIRQTWNGDDHAVGVFWLPPFHDMGLIGGILETLYVGGSSVLMSPTAFIKGPLRWLEAISRHRATITAAPNFAFDMCVELTTPEQRAALDLSSWSVAMCGAEPVRPATLRDFAEAFAPAGFRPEAYYPVYGLAEGTLLVSGDSESPQPTVLDVDRVALRDNRIVVIASDDPAATPLVGCGRPQGGQRVVIVDPQTHRQCPSGHVGEIWVHGPSVARGYWGRPEQSAETFGARLADTGEGPFLRTGDLGFLHDGELFVTGRSKDLIIIRGTNHYPNDIELTVQDCDPALLRGRGAVFAVTPESGGGEQLVVVQEVDPSRLGAAELDTLIDRIRTAVTTTHQVRTHAVVLAQPLQLPTTSSGKIQRHAARWQYLDHTLPVVTAWQAASPPPVADTVEAGAEPAPATAAAGPRSVTEIRQWLIARLAAEVEVPAAEIDTSQPFAYYGLDSVHAVRLSTALEQWLGTELTPTIAYEYPSIDILSRHLAGADDEPAATAGDQPAAPRDEPVAIVGIGCRFPGADGPDAFWQLLTGGVDAVGRVPADRWDADAFYNPDPAVPGTAVTRDGGFLRGVDQFDAAFFGISPREADQMDPQQRLLLEVAWEALEDAGQVPEDLAGSRTGVFVGIATNDYGALRLGQPQLVDAYTGTGNALSIAANRLSYMFDFHGPSLAVDTACSSSLVAVDLACRSLRDGECTMAVAAGVNVILSPALMINFTKARVMAADGHCKTFAADADGYVRGEGAGVVVLKPLSRAIADNDPIYAVIRGSATNSDGRTNGLIAPSAAAQEAVLKEAYRRAGIAPAAVGYVEAHGTGTALGDAIEAKALGAVLAAGRRDGDRCLVGSVKTNIGHLEAAAGVAGLIKVALALRHRQIPASLHFTDPNPHIPFAELPLQVVDTLTAWPEDTGRAVAGVSSFGFGGTNAHVVLTEAPQVRATPAAAASRPELLALSARSPEALDALVGEYEMQLVTGAPLGDLCYTAGARRGHHDYRLCVVGDSQSAMFEALAAYRQHEERPGLSVGRRRPGRAPTVTFVFSGQGSQWLGMGRRLHEQEPVFAEALLACDQALHPHLGMSVITEMTGVGQHSGTPLGDIGVIQPAIFAIQVALAALWRSWGVHPAAVVGHSMGEVAAAHVAGALTLDDAARVIATRARLLRRVRGQGTMVLTELTEAEAGELIAGHTDHVAVAAHNSHRSTVLSGAQPVLANLMAELERRDRFCRWIDVDVASHSPQMQSLTIDLRAALADLTPTAPTVPFYSTVTGGLLTDRPLDAGYWVDNLRRPVRFSPVVQGLLRSGHDTVVEISPHPILLIGVREDAAHLDTPCTVLPSLRREDSGQLGRAAALGSLGALYTLGQPIAWQQVFPAGSRPIPAPTYPWQRVRAWLDAGALPTPAGAAPARPAETGLAWVGPLHSAAHPDTVIAEVSVGTEALPALAEHRINGTTVAPAALVLRLALVAITRTFGRAQRTVRDVVFDRPWALHDAAGQTLQVVLRGDPATAVSFDCYTADHTAGATHPRSWSRLAHGTVATAPPAVAADATGPLDVVRGRCASEVDGDRFYDELDDAGLHYGSALRVVTTLWRRDGEALARLGPGAQRCTVDDMDAAAVVDACVRVLAATLPGAEAGIFVASGIEAIDKTGTLADVAWCHAVLTDAAVPTGEVTLLDDNGAVVVRAAGLRLQRLTPALPPLPVDLRDRLYQLHWQPASITPESDGAEPAAPAGSWLIFGDGATVEDTLRDYLEAHGQSGVFVAAVPGLDAVARPTADTFHLDPARPEQFRVLVDILAAEQRPPVRAVVHLWNLLACPTRDTTLSGLQDAATVGTASVVHLVQALSRADWPVPPRLWLVTGGVQVTDDEPAAAVAVAQAPVWGLGRTVDHEHPELRCTLVDLSADPGAQELRALFGEMWADSAETEVVLHGYRRYVGRLIGYDDVDSERLAVTVADHPTITDIRDDATYLITGGLGAVGLVVAEWLVERGARHLLLTGRSAPGPSARDAIAALEATGAQVQVVAADVTRIDEVKAVVAETAVAGMPPLRGVVHAAGTVADAILDRLQTSDLRAVMAPKVDGAWNLHTATAGTELDFFVLFSSAASVLGSPGAANYGAANAFCDALAWHRRSLGLPALAVNWGPWADLGFFTRSELHRHFSHYGVHALTATDSLRALAVVLPRSATQVAVLDIDWAQWRPGSTIPMLTALRDAAPAAPPAVAGDLRLRLRDADPDRRREVIETYLRDLTAAKLGLAPARLDLDAPLNNLGVDSLITLELRIQVERELGVVVPVARLLDGPSVRALADWLSTQLPGDLGAPSPAAEPAAPAAPAAPAPTPDMDLLAQVGDLSDDAVDELLRDVLSTAAPRNLPANEEHR